MTSSYIRNASLENIIADNLREGDECRIVYASFSFANLIELMRGKILCYNSSFGNYDVQITDGTRHEILSVFEPSIMWGM